MSHNYETNRRSWVTLPNELGIPVSKRGLGWWRSECLQRWVGWRSAAPRTGVPSAERKVTNYEDLPFFVVICAGSLDLFEPGKCIVILHITGLRPLLKKLLNRLFEYRMHHFRSNFFQGLQGK